jgi:hypothetical protein
MDEDLKRYLDEKFASQIEQTAAMASGLRAEMGTMASELRAEMGEMASRLTEQLRDMQTELLRGFESFSAGQTIRLRKVEVDQSNLDTSLSGRVNIVEARLTQIELRLGRQ